MSSAFMGSLGVLEVVLRNALDRELGKTFNGDWFIDPRFKRIDPKMLERIAVASNGITNRSKSLTRTRLVAELSFGFWVHLLRPGPKGSYVPKLWGPALSNAFPTGVKRSTIVGRLSPLLTFRNRVAHHEPIFQLSLLEKFESTLAAIGLMAPKLVPWVEYHSRVRELISIGPSSREIF